MTDLKCIKLNEVYMQVQCDAGIATELMDYFSFFVPNYKYMPKFKSGMWDGRIRLFNLDGRKMYIGLLYPLAQFAKRFGYTMEVSPELYPRSFEQSTFDGFVDSLDPTGSDGKSILLREYQHRGLETSVKFNRCVIESPTASGKSLMIYGLTRWFLEHVESKHDRVLIVVPTISLVYQMAKDFAEYSQKNGWDARDMIHCISGGEEKNSDKPIVISTWQSIYKLPKPWFNDFGCVIGDEAHRYKAQEIGKVVEKCSNAFYRVGFTGTLDDAQANKLQIQGLFGKAFDVADTKDLMDAGMIANLDVQILNLEYDDETSKVVAPLDFQNERKVIRLHRGRAKFVSDLAYQHQNNVLVLYNNVAHGEALVEELGKLNKDGTKKIIMVDGSVSKDDRNEARIIAEENDNCIMVCSYGVFSTGVNIKNIHYIILAYPVKSMILLLQSIGRGLRLHKEKEKLVVYDLVDQFFEHPTKRTKPKTAIKHGNDRVEIYERSRFDYKFSTINVEQEYGGFI